MIVINNPNNPTGAIIPRDVLLKIVDVARKHDIILLSDEVYSPLYHGLGPDDDADADADAVAVAVPPSVLSPSLGDYRRVVATGSMSKAWALAGIRVGWLASRDAAIVAAAAAARHYTAISASQLDDQVAAYALGDDVRPRLLARNVALARRNLGLLDRFVRAHPAVCAWAGDARPRAGTTAFVQFRSRRDGDGGEGEGEGGGQLVDDVALCKDVLAKTKVLLVPGSRCFGHSEDADFRGHVRFGYVCETEVLEQALERLGEYVEEYLAS